LLALVFESKTVPASKTLALSIELSDTPSAPLAGAKEPITSPAEMAAGRNEANLLVLSLEQISRPMLLHIV
jgi:hypothetical protein